MLHSAIFSRNGYHDIGQIKGIGPAPDVSVAAVHQGAFDVDDIVLIGAGLVGFVLPHGHGSGSIKDTGFARGGEVDGQGTVLAVVDAYVAVQLQLQAVRAGDLQGIADVRRT